MAGNDDYMERSREELRAIREQQEEEERAQNSTRRKGMIDEKEVIKKRIAQRKSARKKEQKQTASGHGSLPENEDRKRPQRRTGRKNTRQNDETRERLRNQLSNSDKKRQQYDMLDDDKQENKTEKNNVQQIVNMMRNGELPEQQQRGNAEDTQNGRDQVRINSNDVKLGIKREQQRLNNQMKLDLNSPDTEQTQEAQTNNEDRTQQKPSENTNNDNNKNSGSNNGAIPLGPDLRNKPQNIELPDNQEQEGGAEELRTPDMSYNLERPQQGKTQREQTRNSGNNSSERTNSAGLGTTAAAAWLGANRGSNIVNNAAIEQQRNQQTAERIGRNTMGVANLARNGAGIVNNALKKAAAPGKGMFSMAKFRHASILVRLGALGSLMWGIIFILMVIGALSFFMNMPGMVIDNMKEWLVDMGLSMRGYIVGHDQATSAQIEQLATDMYNERNRFGILGLCIFNGYRPKCT